MFSSTKRVSFFAIAVATMFLSTSIALSAATPKKSPTPRRTPVASPKATCGARFNRLNRVTNWDALCDTDQLCAKCEK